MTELSSDESLKEIAGRLCKARVLCVGDVMLDRFVTGSVSRISPESPVPVLVVGAETSSPGGAANVAMNVHALGAFGTLIGVVGADEGGAKLGDLLRGTNLATALVADRGRPTTQKTRFVAQGQQMLRTDVESSRSLDGRAEKLFLKKFESVVENHNAIILSDYAKGVLTEEILRRVIAIAREAKKHIVVDPKSADISRYSGATIITPNSREILLATGIDPIDGESAVRAGREVLTRAELDAVLVTRGESGMTLVRKDSFLHISSAAREVFDVVGAGDTVTATLGAALAAGASLEVGAQLANLAAGVVVGKRGTATVSLEELLLALNIHAHGPVRWDQAVVMAQQEAATAAKSQATQKKIVGFTNGVFDILHPGHISLLKYARRNCDYLIVGINSDRSVRKLKGSGRPINGEADRAAVVGALGMVDAVVIFDDETPLSLIEAVRPDVLVKGADYRIDTVVGASFVQSYGGSVMLAPIVPGNSSTSIINRAGAGLAS